MVSSRAMKDSGRMHLGMVTNHHLMGSKVHMVYLAKAATLMDSKAPTVDRVVVAAAAAVVVAAAMVAKEVEEVVAMEDGGVMRKVVGGMDVMLTVQKEEGVTEVAEAVVDMTVEAMTVVVMSAVATIVVEEADLLVWEVVTVVASKITVDLETMAQGMNQLGSRTTLTTTPFLSRDWEKTPRFRKLVTSSNKLESSR